MCAKWFQLDFNQSNRTRATTTTTATAAATRSWRSRSRWRWSASSCSSCKYRCNCAAEPINQPRTWHFMLSNFFQLAQKLCSLWPIENRNQNQRQSFFPLRMQSFSHYKKLWKRIKNHYGSTQIKTNVSKKKWLVISLPSYSPPLSPSVTLVTYWQ